MKRFINILAEVLYIELLYCFSFLLYITEKDMDFEDVSTVLKESEQVIRQCFSTFRLDEVFLSFNGGKDCTVLLDIALKILKDIYKRDDIAKDFKVVYIRTNGPFREIESFVKLIEAHYGVSIAVTEGAMKDALQHILNKNSKYKACLLGTRRTDPYSEGLKFMQQTDPHWPQVLRVSPLLNWNYHHIWSYIHQNEVPYCELYAKGYTSIGSTKNTWPNPALSYKDKYGHIAYHPAWTLTDASQEREGRSSKKISNGHPTIHNLENGHNFPSS